MPHLLFVQFFCNQMEELGGNQDEYFSGTSAPPNLIYPEWRLLVITLQYFPSYLQLVFSISSYIMVAWFSTFFKNQQPRYGALYKV